MRIAPLVNVIVLHASWLKSTVSPSSALATVARKLPLPPSLQLFTTRLVAIAAGAVTANAVARHAPRDVLREACEGMRYAIRFSRRRCSCAACPRLRHPQTNSHRNSPRVIARAGPDKHQGAFGCFHVRR